VCILLELSRERDVVGRARSRRIESVRLTIRAGQVCELGDFSTPNQA